MAAGMIIPPPDLRVVIDQTAGVVAKNGVMFQNRIMCVNQSKPKFGFLKASSPYHAYYQHKVALEKRGKSKSNLPSDVAIPRPSLTVEPDRDRVLQPPVEQPEPEQFLLGVPEGVTREDFEVVKLLAQFAARNGVEFLVDLAATENYNNYSKEFSVLNPEHCLYTTLVTLLNAYSKVLQPRKGFVDELKKRRDKGSVLERCRRRVEWERYQQKENKKIEEEKDRQRERAENTNWHDFVVANGKAPAPVTLPVAMDDTEPMEVDLEDSVTFVNVPVDGGEAAMRVVSNWKRSATESDELAEVVVSPMMTSEMVPVSSEIQEHVQVSLINPKFMEHKKRSIAKRKRDSSDADNDEISHIL